MEKEKFDLFDLMDGVFAILLFVLGYWLGGRKWRKK